MTASRTLDSRWWAICAGASILLTALVFNRIVFAGEWLARRDTLRVYLPLARYWAERVRAGELPEWYPYNALGQPYVGMIVSAPFHPSKLLYLLFPVEHAFSINTLLCYPVAAVATFACARRLGLTPWAALFAGLTYALSGYMVSISQSLLYLMAGATLPLALWAADRFFEDPRAARLAPAAVLLASILYAGDIQSFVLCAAAALLLALTRPGDRPLPRRAAAAALLLAFAAALSLPLLLPARDTQLQARGAISTLSIAQSFSLHPLRLLELALGPLFIDPQAGVIPQSYTGFFSDRIARSEWVDSIAIGAAALVLAAAGAIAAARRRLGLVLIAAGLLSLGLVLGRHLPLYELFFRFVPLWDAFRYPQKLLVWLTLLLALAAGFGLDRALGDARFARRLLLGLSGVALLAVALAAGASEELAQALGLPPQESSRVVASARSLAVGAALSAGMTAVCLGWMRPRAAQLTALCLQGALLLWLNLPIPQGVSLDVIRQQSGFVPQLLAAKGGEPAGPRVERFAPTHKLPRLQGYSPREVEVLGGFATLGADMQALFGLETSAYYQPAGSTRMVKAFQHEKWSTLLAPLYGTGFYIVSLSDLRAWERQPGMKLVDVLPAFGVALLATGALPRAYLAWPLEVGGFDDALRTIADPSFRPGEDAVVECPRPGCLGGAPGAGGSPGTARVLTHGPERVEVEVSAEAGSVLVLNDAHYSGWTVTVDGEPAEILPTNAVVRGVLLPAGSHRVRFEYRQPHLRLGVAGAAAALAVLVAAAARDAARRRRLAAEARA